MEIKTIYARAGITASIEAFDNCVNEALKEGWTLVKRELVQPKAQPSTGTMYNMLYAELERSTSDED